MKKCIDRKTSRDKNMYDTVKSNKKKYQKIKRIQFKIILNYAYTDYVSTLLLIIFVENFLMEQTKETQI